MDASNAVRAMVAGAGFRLRDVSRAMGKSESLLSSTLNAGGGVSSRTLAAAAAVCGYRLALVPEGALPPNSFTIDPPEIPAS